MKKPLTVLAVLCLELSVGSGALAAKGLLTGADIQDGSVSGADIRKQSLGTALLTASATSSLRGADGWEGPRGSAGPSGSTVVLAKTQLSHTGAGDSIDCMLKAGSTTLDQIALKTLPALAAVPTSLRAVTTTVSPTLLGVQVHRVVCKRHGHFSTLIAIPTA